MAYFKEKKLNAVVNNIECGIMDAMRNLDPNGRGIDAWDFDNKGDIILYQELQNEVYTEVGKIFIDIDEKEIEVLEEEEFVLQMEDLLLEVDDRMGNNNLLFKI